MKRILVTGGAGFIGSNFIHFILEKYPGIHVTNLDKLTYAGNLENLRDIERDSRYTFIKGDISGSNTVEEAMSGVEGVVNFAAETHVDRSILYAGDFIRTDVEGTFILLESARKFGVKRFVQISTDEVYGEAPGRQSVETDPLMPKSPYAASKAGADRLAYSYYTTYKLPVVISRCSNNYGPCQYPEKLIPLFVTEILENKPVPVYGTGKNTRDWIYVKDHCRAIDLLLHGSGDDGEVYNIGADTEKSVLDITDTIMKTLGAPETLVSFVKDRAGHVTRHAVNCDKFKKSYDWSAENEFNDLLKSTILWYKEHSEWWTPIKHRTGEFKKYYTEQYLNR